MIEIAETALEILVSDPEYRRLLGYPRGREPEARASELMDWARAWYAAHGRPWLYAREAGSLALAHETVVLEGVPFACARLERRLREAEAGSAVLVAVSAGPELEAEAQRLWGEEKPDEYFFLEVYGSAVVEYLARAAGARLCAAAERTGHAVLPHYSPGYPEWDVAEQGRLLQLIRRGPSLPGPLEVLESGMSRPKKSLLAVFGLTPRTDRVRPLGEIVACETCTLPRCHFRRAPYGGRRTDTPAEPEKTTVATPAPGNQGPTLRSDYRNAPVRLMAAIAGERPLPGHPLDAVLSWARASVGPRRYPEPDSRRPTWGLVLETSHLALARVERRLRQGMPSLEPTIG